MAGVTTRRLCNVTTVEVVRLGLFAVFTRKTLLRHDAAGQTGGWSCETALRLAGLGGSTVSIPYNMQRSLGKNRPNSALPRIFWDFISVEAPISPGTREELLIRLHICYGSTAFRPVASSL